VTPHPSLPVQPDLLTHVLFQPTPFNEIYDDLHHCCVGMALGLRHAVQFPLHAIKLTGIQHG
jgi:hypothetical protein